ncbi:MAG: hypothetical protein AB8B50_13200 [Pirellulaceae bacterium]
MESSQNWCAIFKNWPEGIDKNGTLVTKFGESVPFCSFMLAEGLVLLERNTPDPAGARKAVVGLDSIAVVKINSPLPMPEFQPMGFQFAASCAQPV